MKSVAIRNASILLGILFLGAACTSAHVQHGAIHREFIGKRIAVFNTDGKITGQLDWTIVVAGALSELCGEHAAAYLETELMPHYRVAERGLLKPILEELKLNASGLIEPHTAIKIGRLAGLDGIVTVHSDFDVVWIFPLLFAEGNTQAKLISVETGDLVWSSTAKHTAISVIPIVPIWLNNNKQVAEAIVEKLQID